MEKRYWIGYPQFVWIAFTGLAVGIGGIIYASTDNSNPDNEKMIKLNDSTSLNTQWEYNREEPVQIDSLKDGTVNQIYQFGYSDPNKDIYAVRKFVTFGDEKQLASIRLFEGTKGLKKVDPVILGKEIGMDTLEVSENKNQILAKGAGQKTLIRAYNKNLLSNFEYNWNRTQKFKGGFTPKILEKN